MAQAKIGFITSGGGGNPTGIGDYVNRLNSAGLTAVIMCNDGDVGIGDALATGGNHVLLFRVVRDGSEQYSVPDYSLSPQAAAVKHWQLIRPFFHPAVIANKDRVWVQPINEVDKNRASWLGDFGIELARIANGEGYKVAMFAFSSGEPEPFHWVTPGMVRYLQYCESNHERAAVALHEYDLLFDGMVNTYPWHIGRFEFLYQTCDDLGIRRPLVLITEFGWKLDDVPALSQVIEDLDFAGLVYSQYADVLGAGIWYLGGGHNGIANKVQPLIEPVTNFILTTIYPEPPTEPDPPGDPTMQTYSFEDPDWTVLTDRLQQPKDMILTVIAPGSPLWYPGGLQQATGTVEALHKGCNFVPPNLPPHQCADGSDPLVLDYFRCYKIQAVDMASGTSLKYTFPGAGRKRVTIPVQVHWQVDQPNEVDDVIVGVLLNGVEIKRLQHPELKDRTWHYVTGEADGPVTVELRFQTSYRNRRDLFTDKWTDEELEPMTWQEQVEQIAKGKRVLAYKAGSSLQVVPSSHGFQVATNEFDFARPDGSTIRCRETVHPITAERRIYYAVIPNWSDVRWWTVGGSQPDNPFNFKAYPVPSQAYFITSPFNAGRPSYPPTTNQLHEGVDLRAPFGTPIAAVADGVVDGLRVDPGYGYGTYVRIKHNDRYLTWYGHLKNYIVQLGQSVTAGQIIGYADSTGDVWPAPTPTNPTAGTHLHLTLVDLEQGLDGYIVNKVINPKPFLDALQTPAGIDLRRFMIADPAAFRVVRMPDGRQEEIQDMQLGGGLFVRRKNDLGEWWKVDGQYFYLVHDTSPDTGGAGIERVYTLTKGSLSGAPKNPLFMTVGQSWQETGTHYVQFRAKSGCGLLTENSGFAQNTAVLVDRQTNYTFNTYGQNLTIDEVVWIKTGSEMQIYGRHNGKAVGWLGWSAPWGKSEIVELYWNRPPMTEEPNRYCSW